MAAQAQAAGGSAVVGGMAVTQQGSVQTITTTNGKGGFSAINWQSFSVPGGTTTFFAQPDAASLSINRVTGANPSAIYGTLGSNGRLVLVNPAGITVGAGAVVDTAGFTASTLRMADADLAAGRLRFEGGAGGLLRVDGKVIAHSGDVVLIGQDVQTGPSALVQTPQGATVLAAGQKVEVTGRGLEGIVFEVQAPTDQAVNLGTLQGDAVGVFAGTLRHSGLIQAQAVTTEGGRVVLKAAGTAIADGAIRAQGAAGQGGQADVLGAKVGVLAGATIDTSNTAGGGQIRVGGDYQGKNASVQNAQVTYVDQAATLRANATEAGNGGKVIVWADDTTRMHGTIQANAGANGGDGGFVETSGKRYLDVRGASVQASAARGAAGTWLLDPDDLRIIAAPAPSAAPAPAENYSGDGYFSTADDGSTSVVWDSTINAALNAGGSTNVLVQTSGASTGSATLGDIYLEGATIYRDAAGSGTLTLSAWNDIVVRNGTTTFETRIPPVPSPTPTLPPPPPSLLVSFQAGQRGTGETRVESGGTLLARSLDPAGSVALESVRAFTNAGNLVLGAGSSLVVTDTLTNSGTLSASGASLAASNFSQTGGSTGFGAGSDFRAVDGFSLGGGTFGFNGRNLELRQSSTGDLVLGSGAAISATDSVLLSASDGDVVIGRALSSGGAMAVNGRTLSIGGALQADQMALISYGDDGSGVGMSQTAAITARELMVSSSYGMANLTHVGNSVQALAASAPVLTFTNKADLLTIKAMDNWLADGFLPGLQGEIHVTNNAASAAAGSGSVRVDAEASVWVDALSIHAAGNIDAQAAIRTFGKYQSSPVNLGSVDLTAGGTINYTEISTYGGAIGSMGAHGGDLLLSAGTGVFGGYLDASGVAPDSSVPRNGGNIMVTTATGDVSIDSIRSMGGYYGGSGGTVSLASGSGNLNVGWVDVSGGYSPDGVGGAGGKVVAAGAAGIDMGSISAQGGSGMQGSGVGAVVSLSSSGGNVVVRDGIDATGGSGYAGNGGHGGAVTVTAGGGVQLGTIWLDGGYGSAAGGNAGSLSVTAAGDVVLTSGESPALVAAATSFYGTAVSASGGDSSMASGGGGGSVLLRSTGGNVSVQGWIDAYGSDSGAGMAGNGGSVQVSAAGNVAVGSIDASGGYADAGNGGNGGNVTLTSGGTLSVSDIYASGGDGGSGPAAGGQGGKGGSISLTAGTGDLHLDGLSIIANGGWGGAHASVGGTGGAGGSITLRANGGGVFASAEGGDPDTETFVYGTYIDSEGGSGGQTYGTAAGDRGGAGGAGGTIQVQASGPSQLLGSFSASGGSGGFSDGGGSAVGGTGGAGGMVSISTTSPAATVLLGGDVIVLGGVGGEAGTYDEVIGWIPDPSRTGVQGTSGTFFSNVAGGLFVGPSLDVPTTEPTPSYAASSLSVVGNWTNSGTVVLQPGAWVRNVGTMTNNGVLHLGGGSLLSVGTYDEMEDVFTPGLGSLVNRSAGVVQGTGMLQANVANAGVLSPGDAAGQPGALTILGDLVLQSGGKLVLDVAPNTPPVPGTTHDQLVVTGALTLGGGVQVNAIPAVASPPPAVDGGSQMALATVPDPYVMVAAGSVTAGSEFEAATAPPELVPSLVLSDGGVFRPLIIAAAPPPPTPAPTAAPTPAPTPAPAPAPVSGGTLTDRIVELLGEGASASVVQQALTESNNVTEFVEVLLKSSDDDADKPKGQPDIVQTDTSCKPS
nr:filamentous hemagglutinin N-terminal domain-containing protein [Ramlibacter algicola]